MTVEQAFEHAQLLADMRGKFMYVIDGRVIVSGETLDDYIARGICEIEDVAWVKPSSKRGE